MSTKFAALVVGFGLLCSAVPATAHHSFAAEYDAVVLADGRSVFAGSSGGDAPTQ